MPANLTPEYYKAEKWFRTATTNDEKILALKQMLSSMPKHKGTDHLKADLRKKLSKLKETAEKQKGGKQVDVFHVPRTGAGQVALIGTPNSGKSSIVSSLTNAKVNVAEFPFATGAPVPGMVEFEDIQIQLLDMPPLTDEFISPGQVGTYRNCDLIGIVIDLSGSVKGQMDICLDFLESRRLLIEGETTATDDEGNVLGKRAVCIGTKADIAREGALSELKSSSSRDFEYAVVSSQTGRGLDTLSQVMFDNLFIVRVYSKPPGKDADMNEPFALPRGSTITDLALAVHRDLAEKLQSARIWGTGVYDGQNVQLDHVLRDKDVIELHFA